MRITVILTGGTAGSELQQGIARLPQVDQVERICRQKAHGDRLSFLRPFNRFSEDIGPQQWLELAETIAAASACSDGIVVVHGTDTMAYSAGAAALLNRDLTIPVVFTGSMLPSGLPHSDLPGNIEHALGVVRSNRRGCYLAFHGQLHRASQCRNDLSRPGCFASMAENPGYPVAPPLPSERKYFDSNVLQLRLYPGMPLDLITSAALAASGVIVELYASGTAPSMPEHSLVDLVALLSGHQIPVCLTRPWGVSDFDYPAWPEILDAGAIDLGDCFTEFATVKLMWALAQGSQTAILMQTPCCGELDSGRIIQRSGLALKSFSLQKEF